MADRRIAARPESRAAGKGAGDDARRDGSMLGHRAGGEGSRDRRPPPRLEFAGACMSYGELEVLRDVSLTVGETEIVSLVGPSGCGKTTLLRCAGGLTRLASGAARVDGEVVIKPMDDVSMVFQHFGLFPWKNLWNNIAYGLKIRHAPRTEIERKVSEIIELVGLTGFERSYPRQLSGGMQQRAGLARALVMEPRLLLMDEPFSAIDAQTRELLQFHLLHIWDERPTAMLFVTHSIDEAVLMGDRVVLLGGRPSRVREVFTVDLPRPRDHSVLGHPVFIRTRDQLRNRLFEEHPERQRVMSAPGSLGRQTNLRE